MIIESLSLDEQTQIPDLTNVHVEIDSSCVVKLIDTNLMHHRVPRPMIDLGGRKRLVE